ALIKLATDFPHAQVPTSVLVPEGKTDATVSPITTIPVPGATIGTVRAAYGLGWQESSLGLFPILWGISLSNKSVVGGAPVLGTATLLNPAPPGGVEVALVNNDSDLITLPPSVFIPAGGTGATFDVLTLPVSVPTRVTIDAGTGFEGYRSPGAGLTLLPAGSPEPPPSLSSLTLASANILGEGSTTGTVTLAPAGGGAVTLTSDDPSLVQVPPTVSIPAGNSANSFTITTSPVVIGATVRINATAGGVTRSAFINLGPDPNAPPLLASVTL